MTEYCLTADMMPMGMAMVQVNITVKRPKSSVSRRRSPTSSFTGRWNSREKPRSPRSRFQSHFKYCL